MRLLKHKLLTIATASAVAFVVYSCGGKLSEAAQLNLSETPVQVVDSLFMVQTDNGGLKMRVEADVMERYDNDTCSYELFPKGLHVFAYSEEDMLETVLHSNNARHFKSKKRNTEMWSAFGNVIVQNIMKQQTLETDTLYWDQANKEIYTDCYVRMFTNDDFMQGFGMRSDEMARNAILFRPFNSYVYVIQDSTRVIIDSVNFIGPLLKKK
ncbi:MAG: LPS export ABC transporter periplasmic protein LptC [Bacteroidales bacterium]|nr:LPS export ABC transporter periplasmic protein LptC [Bacteroidales bacterium]MBR7005075.1 LPS export ABC transporter periplasmic protein LptC [Bacteroidales bacterium]